MEFFGNVGVLAVASRLRATSERFYGVANEAYARHGIPLQSRWFPVLRLIHDRGPQTIGEIAEAIGQTHSAVSQLAARLVRDGWLSAETGKEDRRRTRLDLTSRCKEALHEVRPVWRAMRDEIEARCTALGLRPMQMLDQLDTILDASFGDAIAARTNALRREAVTIVPFRQNLREHFYRLNAAWLERYFYLEEVDHRVLSSPETEILAGGGAIFFALMGDEVVGTCALLQVAPGEYELTKMAVDPEAQGLGIGRQLIDAALAAFRERGGGLLFLETNTKLAAAIRLYESTGFERQPVTRADSHYQRANVYMVWRGVAGAGEGN